MDRETGEIAVGRCHATTFDKCEPCARLHVGDSKQIIRAGIAQWIEAGYDISFLTLTAPGLWLPDSPEQDRGTHRFHKPYWAANRGSTKPNRKTLNRLRSSAICGHCTQKARAEARAAGRKARDVPPVIHSPEDPLAGLPIHLDTFDYFAAAWWNWTLGERFHRTITYLRRILGDDLQYLKVVEWSRRGVPHIHLLINRPLTDTQASELINTVNHSYGTPSLGWGPVHDTQTFHTHRKQQAREIGRLTSYLSKYLAKDTGATITTVARHHPHAGEHFRRLRHAAHRIATACAPSRHGGPCPKGCGGNLYPDDTDRTLHCDTCRHATWNRIPHYTASLGLRTHRLTKSRQWAVEHRASHTRPGRWLPVWHHTRRGWTPKPLTYRAIRQQRRCHNLRIRPTAIATTRNWTYAGTRTIYPPTEPTIDIAQPNAPPATT